MPFSAGASISFFDVTCKMAFIKNIDESASNVVVELDDLNTGIYWVKIQMGNVLVWKKLIVFKLFQ